VIIKSRYGIIIVTYHNLQGFGVEDMNLVCVATPQVFVAYYAHAAHRVDGLTQINNVVVGQVPLAI
jgi:hypothetical protein